MYNKFAILTVFQGDSSAAMSTFTMLYNHHHCLFLKYFHHLRNSVHIKK